MEEEIFNANNILIAFSFIWSYMCINNAFLAKEKVQLFIKNLQVCITQFCKTVINSCPSKPVKMK